MAASHYQVGEMDSGPADSLSSTPRSDHHHHLHDDGATSLQPRVRFMCSIGGKILPRPHDNQLRYVGGDTRIVVVHRHATFSSLLSKLSKLAGTSNISIKYQLPNEDLDALITVTADEDVENMMEEYDRLSQNKSARLRLFLFNIDDITSSRSTSISSLLDGSAKRESWFVDALNGGPGSGPVLERGRSEVSSIVSEVPDYLFGLDNQEDTMKEPKLRNKNLLNDSVSISDPGSPAPVVSSPFGSTSSSLAPPNVQAIPDLPPVKTKPVNPVQTMDQVKETRVGHEILTENTGLPQPPVYSSGPGPMWHYPGPAMQPVPAVYYMPGAHQVQPANMQPVPMQAQFVQPYPVVPSQVPVGFPQTVSSMGQVYGASVRPYDMNSRVVHDGANQAMYFAQGVRNAAFVPGPYPGMVAPGVDEIQVSGLDVAAQGHLSQGP
ncbi:protein PAL OF QUIRKY-like [Henckelia pumila]|uniref:protein PAL OF QUIRKY-like n=1 Tax=Henckelia pumila TaxID=405737 RepID=UPI003C6DD1BE